MNYQSISGLEPERQIIVVMNLQVPYTAENVLTS